MPQTNVKTSPAINRFPPEHWHTLWLEKTREACERQKIKESTAAGFGDFIGRFLAPHACHPGKVPVEQIPVFIRKYGKSEKQAKFCRDALLFFYTNVVPSENHCSFIKNQTFHSQPPKIPTPVQPSVKPKFTDNNQIQPLQPTKNAMINISVPIADYLKRMYTELKARNYSLRTIKNYSAAVHQFLLWLKREPSRSDVLEIKKFQIYLKEERNYSPRTVNLVTAAIQFFYKCSWITPLCSNPSKDEDRQAVAEGIFGTGNQ